MLKCGSDIKLVKFYKKSSEMSGKGRGKSKKRDIITASQIRPAPGKVKAAGNLPKSKKLTETKNKSKPKSSKIENRSKADVQHDQFSSDGEEESASNDEVPQESTSEESISAVDEEDFPPEYHDQNDEEGDADADEEENECSWKCKLLEFIQQYPEVYDKASPRYKKKNLREAAWDDIATAMESDGISVYSIDFPQIWFHFVGNNLKVD